MVRRGLWIARMYGVAIGAIAMGIWACATTDIPDQPSIAPPTINTTNTQTADKDLTPGQRVRAIAARRRAELNGSKPKESIQRVFDAMGKLKHEYVRRDTSWIERPGTLPAGLQARPLASFLISPRQAAIFSGDTLSGASYSGTTYDSLNSVSATYSDSGLINYSTGVAIDNRDSGDPTLVTEADLFASNGHYVDQMWIR